MKYTGIIPYHCELAMLCIQNKQLSHDHWNLSYTSNDF